MKSVLVDTLPVEAMTFDETVRLLVGWAREGSGGYVTTPNVDHVVRAHGNRAFRQIVLDARLRVPDGMGIVYGARLAGTPLRGTVTGRLLPEAVARSSADSPIATALVGGHAQAIGSASERLTAAGAKVVAALAPRMGFEIGGEEDGATLAALREAAPRLLYVGLGSPKQERWMARHSAELPGTVMVGVGQAIDILGGHAPAAPRWMTRIGLEWAFRMVRDPLRIGRRVFIGTPRFGWWMLRARFSSARADRGARDR